jgi:hypothetical protein
VVGLAFVFYDTSPTIREVLGMKIPIESLFVFGLHRELLDIVLHSNCIP